MPEPRTAGAILAAWHSQQFSVDDAADTVAALEAENATLRAALAQAERERDAAYEQAATWCEERAEKIRAYAVKTPDTEARQRRYDAAEWVQGCADSIRFRAAPPPEEEAS